MSDHVEGALAIVEGAKAHDVEEENEVEKASQLVYDEVEGVENVLAGLYIDCTVGADALGVLCYGAWVVGKCVKELVSSMEEVVTKLLKN